MPLYLQNLKESIIESYTGIVFGVKDSLDTSVLKPYVPAIYDYIYRLCSTNAAYEIDFIKSIVGLIGDVSSIFGREYKSYITQPHISKLINILESNPTKDYQAIANWAKTSINKALK